MTHDPFRPLHDPARSIYDAFRREAQKRIQSPVVEWDQQIVNERLAVHEAAREIAIKNGLRIPSLAEVEQEENLAMGDFDYGSKWAHGVAQRMTKHEGYRAEWVNEILEGRSVLELALDVHMHVKGTVEGTKARFKRDLSALKEVAASWKNKGLCRFDDAVLEVVLAAIEEAE